MNKKLFYKKEHDWIEKNLVLIASVKMKGLNSFFIVSPSRIPCTGFCTELFI